MESLTLRAFVWYDVVELRRPELTLMSCRRSTVVIRVACQGPLRSGLVDGRVRTFGLACPAVNAIAGNVDGHGVLVVEDMQNYEVKLIFGECRSLPPLRTSPLPMIRTSQHVWFLCLITFLSFSSVALSKHGYGSGSTTLPRSSTTSPRDTSLAVLSGFVEDSATKETLVGATVAITGTKLGAYTNKSGFFSINNIRPGTYAVTVSMVGFARRTLDITLRAGESKRVRVALSSGDVSMREVNVTASREAERRQINISKVNVPMEQIATMRIGGEADIFRALQMLPGVLTSSQISSGLFIRGGSPDQNLVLLDGMTVYNPTHLFGFISAFNSDAIKDVELLKGGFPAEYGGRMSAVLNVTQKDGNRDHVEGVVGIGLISSRASLQGPIGRGSWFIGGRRTYLDIIKSVIPEDPSSPIPDFGFYDVNAKITQDITDDDKLSISGFLTSDALTFAQPGIEFGIGIGNRATSLRWQHVLAEDLFSVATVSASQYRNDFTGNNAGIQFEIANGIIDYSLKAEIEWFTNEDVTVKAGYEGSIFNFAYKQDFSGGAQPGQSDAVFVLDVWDRVHTGFAQANVNLTDRLAVQTGLRANYWSLSNLATLDPRIALRLQVYDNVAIKASVGRFHQYLRLATVPDFTFFDTWLPTDATVPPSSADHYVLSMESQPFEGYEFNVDVYYKTLRNINELNATQTRAQVVNEVFFIGNGTAYGAEFFLQKKVGPLSGWIGYALGYVQAQFDSINRGASFRPKYDRRHDFKVTALYTLNDRWEFGATFVFQSGQSYTGATSRLQGDFPGVDAAAGVIVPSQRWGLRLPNSHQLNLNANYNTTIAGLRSRVMIDIFNAYSRRDIWFRFYDISKPIPEVTDVRLLPIIPTVSLEVQF